MSNFAPKRTSYSATDKRWIRDIRKVITKTVTLDASLFTGFTSGLIPSGTAVGLVTATKNVGPYLDTETDGRQTATGLLIDDVEVASTGKHLVAIVIGGGPIDAARLPTITGAGAIDANGKADLKTITWI